MRNKLLVSAEDAKQNGEVEEFLEIIRARDLGMEIQEFSLPRVMHGDWKKRLAEYQDLLRDFQGDLAIHNAFWDLVNVSMDPEVLELTHKKFDFHFRIARELGVKIIVSHFHWLPFHRDVLLRLWQEGQIRFWERYVDRAEKEDVYLVTENVFEPRPEILKPIVDRVNSKRFKFIFDIGHANIVSEVPLEDWVKTFGNDLTYMHVHNNYRNYDEHNSVLKGTVNFDYLFLLFERLQIAPILSTEVFDRAALLESLDYLQAKMRASRVYGIEH